MELFFSKLIDSVVEIAFFTLVPFVWWLVTARKKTSFWAWIGLTPVSRERIKPTLLYGAVVTVLFLLQAGYMLGLVKGVEGNATAVFSGLGVRALPAVLVYAALGTALPEEIVFRGFLLKRLSAKTGFAVGNSAQAALFGLLHGMLFAAYVGMARAVIITLFTGGIAWCMGYINEKKAGGSLLPSWAIHTSANLLSGVCAAFQLI